MIGNISNYVSVLSGIIGLFYRLIVIRFVCFQVITLNILANEHKSGEFPKVNPRMCVPTIVDGEFMLWESKAILIYLAQKSCCGPFKGFILI